MKYLIPFSDGSVEQVVAYSKAGAYFGEMALINKTTRSASVYAQTTIKVRIIS